MLDFLKLGRWLPIDGLQDHAEQQAVALATRWDVPQGDWVSKDLRDTVSRFYRTAPDAKGAQSRTASRMLQEDLVLGAFPVSIPLLFALVPLLGLLASALPGMWLPAVPLMAAVPLLFLIATATEKKMWAVAALFLGIALPYTGGAIGAASGSLAGNLAGVMRGATTALVPLAVIACGGLLFGGIRGARLLLGGFLGVAAVAALAAIVPGPLKGLVLALPGCALPAAWAIHEDFRRARRLAVQGTFANFEASDYPLVHIPARKEQALRASKDPTPLITYGTATGILTAAWDGFAPDAGLPMCQSVQDLSTHMLVLGLTGRGKTSSVLLPMVTSYLRGEGKGHGLLVMDGKGELALVFRALKNYLLLDPSRCVVGLYEGMDAVSVAATHRALNVTDESGDQTWNSSAYLLCLHAAVLLEAIVAYTKNEPDREWTWTLRDHYRLTVLGAQASPKDKVDMSALLAHIEGKHKANPGSPLLTDALNYFRDEYPKMPEETRGSVAFNLSAWLGPMLSDPSVLTWATAETGEKVEDCLHGRPVGINIPDTLYGRAGSIATAFLNSRFQAGIKKRAGAPGGWKNADPTATDVLTIIDEAQLVVKAGDHTMASIGRSLGCWLVVCSQSIENLRSTSRNQHLIDGFLYAFGSFISLDTSASTIKWLSDRVGTAWKPQWSGRGAGIDFLGGALNALESPLFEQHHPNRRWMRTMLRLGAGGFHDLVPATSKLNDGHIDRAMSFELRTTAAGDVWRETPLLNAATFKATLAQQGTAFCSLMRGGSPRRDFIKLDCYLSELPADLADPDFVDFLTPEKAAEVAMLIDDPMSQPAEAPVEIDIPASELEEEMA